MPFRVPDDYARQSLFSGIAQRDPTLPEVEAYLDWLNREAALAEEYLTWKGRGDKETEPKPRKEPKP